jgi:hypothetical protein
MVRNVSGATVDIPADSGEEGGQSGELDFPVKEHPAPGRCEGNESEPPTRRRAHKRYAISSRRPDAAERSTASQTSAAR